MNKIFWPLIILFILIHTLDMELTVQYVGNNWQYETFLPMSLCIKFLGIYNAIWVSRIMVYSYMFSCYIFKNCRFITPILLFITILYYVSMVGWLFTLNILAWPAA
jgi:hypothetical protein